MVFGYLRYVKEIFTLKFSVFFRLKQITDERAPIKAETSDYVKL